MGAKSAIEWTDATWNPVTGCTKVSPGCKYCYAERLAVHLQVMGNRRYQNGFAVTLHPDQLTLPMRWRQPRQIFVNSMSDLFHEAVPDEFIHQVFQVMVQAHWHIFQILTKRAQRLADLAPRLPWPPNVWQGVSIENAHYVWRIASLQKVPAAVRFLSIEPLLGPVTTLPLEGIHWVIVGGESGPQHRLMDPAWVRGIRDQCIAAGIPFFFKQWGGKTPKSGGRVLDRQVWNEMPSRCDEKQADLSTLAVAVPIEQCLPQQDVANDRVLGEVMQAPSHSSRQTSWREAFFAERRPTSRLKHLILTPYVKEFAYHLGSVRPTIYYVDGFAGPGIYGGTPSGSEPGSPVLIAEFARQLQATNAPFMLKCLNVEKSDRFYRRLTEATASFAGQIVEKNYHAPFTDALGDILQRIGDAPAFFFIDPFGTKDIPFKDLLPLFNRKVSTEIFITLHTDGIAKKAGWFEALNDTNVRKRKTALALTENLAKALHLSSNELHSWWTECVKRGNGGTAAFEQRVLQHYRTILRPPYTRLQFTKAFPVYYYGSDAPPGAAAPICFYLVFGTQHKKGLYEMNDCMVKALDSFYEQEYGHTFFPLFHNQDKSKDQIRLQQEILTQFHAIPFTIDQVKQHLMQESSLLIKGKGYRDAVLGLKRNGQLEQLDPGQVHNERTRFSVLPHPSDAYGKEKDVS